MSFWTLNYQDQPSFSQYFLSQVCFIFCKCLNYEYYPMKFQSKHFLFLQLYHLRVCFLYWMDCFQLLLNSNTDHPNIDLFEPKNLHFWIFLFFLIKLQSVYVLLILFWIRFNLFYSIVSSCSKKISTHSILWAQTVIYFFEERT